MNQFEKRFKKAILGSISKEGRVRIDAEKRNAIYKRAKGKCEIKGCKYKGVCHIHHINMRNNNNSLSNLELLCPNHHTERHSKQRIKRYSSYDIIEGYKIRKRLVKKKPKVKKAKRKTRKKRKPQGILKYLR